MDKGALSRATDGTSAPTPGYLYNDIGKSLTSPQTCEETLNYLSSRLQKKNPHIKKKCLKVLSKLSVHATNRGMMKRCIVQNPTAISLIKDCIAYKGTIDAVTGDQYNIEVRNAAKECLEVVYSDSGGDTAQSASGGGYGGIGSGQLQGGGMAGLGSNSSPTNNRGQQSGYGSAGQGYGSSSSGSGGGYGAPMGGQSGSGPHLPGVATATGRTSSSMQGIGNPMFSDPRLSQGSSGDALGTLKNVGGAMLDMIKDPLAKNVPGPGLPPGSIGGGGYNPNARPDPYAQPPPGRNNMMAQTGGQWTMASNRGPNAVGSAASNSVPEPPSNHQNSEYYKARNAQGGGQAFSWAANPSPAPAPSAAPPAPTGVGGAWASAPPPQQQQYSQSVAAQSRQPPVAAGNLSGTTPSSNCFNNGGGAVHRGVAVGSGDYEKNLILELCPPGGMKAEPPQDKLEEFANAIPSLNPDLVCPALLDALEEGNPWIMRAKALCVIETVLKVEASRGGEGDVQAYTDFFYECSGEISPLANHARASVKGPAKRVLTMLGVDGSSMMNGATTNGDVVVEAPPPTNLLDFSEEPASTPIDNAPVAAKPSVGGDSLFSGLNTKATDTTQQQSEAPAPPIPVAPTQQQDDLLGGLEAPATTTSVPDVSGSGSGDLFGNMNIKSAEVKVETAQPSDGATAAAVAAGIPSPPSAPASSFGFMNNNNATTPSSPVPPSKAQVSPASPSSKAFDPLLNMGTGNTATNTSNNMTNSPNPNNMAQMQQMQMAYQQNMMMMQQQMQQMQMAQQGNFQRQGSGGYVPGMPPQMMPPSPTKQQVMEGNYMRQVPTVGDNSGFSFLGSDPRKEKNKSFDFVKETMKKG